ncbi:glycosyl transferase family 2, partial [Vulcanisaeta sp. SCGC AB-777_J10]
MLINYGTIIVLIYIVIMISSFYPMIYQLLLISIKDRDTNTKPREDYTSGGKVFLIIPAKAEPLDLRIPRRVRRMVSTRFMMV